MKTRRNIILCFIALGLVAAFPTAVFAETGSNQTPVYNIHDQSLGFHASALSGLGLSYQQWFGKTGAQFTGAVLPTSYADFSYNIGAELQGSVFGSRANEWLSGQLYWFTAFHHGATIGGDGNAYTPVFGVGIGIGIETILFEHFSIPFGLVNGMGISPYETDIFEFILWPQIGFRYRF